MLAFGTAGGNRVRDAVGEVPVGGLPDVREPCYEDGMNAQVLFNQFAYADRLKHGGFSDDQARASAEALASALSEAVATKSDVLALKSDIAAVKSELKSDITKLDSKIDTLEIKLVAGFDAKLEALKSEMLFKLLGSQLAIAGLIVAAIKFIR